MARTYVDSDILIWHLRGETRAAELLRRLASEPEVALWIGAVQRAEIVFFMRPAEIAATRTLLSRFGTHPVTEEVVDRAGEIYRKWHPSHATDVNDALLAAMVLEQGARPYTLNMKHDPMPGLNVVKGW